LTAYKSVVQGAGMNHDQDASITSQRMSRDDGFAYAPSATAQRLALAKIALSFIAWHNGTQPGIGDVPPTELWTLRATLSPELVAGSTVSEEKVLAWLVAEPEPAAKSEPRTTWRTGELRARLAKPETTGEVRIRSFCGNCGAGMTGRL
jgi:hypothetical protein